MKSALLAAVLCGATVCSVSALAQTDTTFTYQGSLADQGVPADGTFNLDFALFDALAGGSQIGSEVMFNNLAVAEGLFTVELDFGASAFDNTSRWIEISVNGSELSPRQPVTRSPYSIQTRGIFVDANHNVGIGTIAPNFPLHVESNSSTPIFARATASSGTTKAGHFTNESTSGRGVYGEATASSGQAYGGYFQSESTSGRGVFGLANASTGFTDGVFGLSNSTGGSGVCGWAPASSGLTRGVFGTSDSTDGRGVYGEARAATGTTYGGRFESSSTSGRGVYGENTASTGTTYGGWFESDSTSGRGVFGYAAAATGTTYGGNFQSASTTGRGVYGFVPHPTGTTYGVYGQSNSTSGHGVFGVNLASSGSAYGVYGRSSSASGHGVFGHAQRSSGTNYGVVGHSDSSSGFDFYASGAGVNYGASSSRRFKSNVEPINNPLSKLARLSGVYFDWDAAHGGGHDVGMIAEEVGKVLPEIVNYEENGNDAIGMDYSKMTPLLVEAVNALRVEKDEEIKQLNQRIAQLEQMILQINIELIGSKE